MYPWARRPGPPPGRPSSISGQVRGEQLLLYLDGNCDGEIIPSNLSGKRGWSNDMAQARAESLAASIATA